MDKPYFYLCTCSFFLFIAISISNTSTPSMDNLEILCEKINEIELKVNDLQKAQEEIKTELDKWEVFEATAYTIHEGNGDGYTATMTIPQEGRTVAVDPTRIPLGSRVHILGRGSYIAEDTGGLIKGDIVDIFMNHREDALRWGRREVLASWN